MKITIKNISSLAYIVYLISVISMLWLLTKSWLPQGFVIAGHDSGLALDAKQFLINRFYAWDSHLNFGQDNSFNFGSIILHFIDYLFSLFTGESYAGNQINIFFWITSIFLSAFVFAVTMRKYLGKFFVYLFPVFITFNFYVFQSIFMLERAKYGLLAATMLFLALAIRVLDKRIHTLLAVLLSSILFFIFNGGGIWGLPLYGGVAVIISIFFLCIVIRDIYKRDFTNTRRLSVFFALSLLGYILINAYAIFPYIAKLKGGDYSMLFDPNITAPNRAWLDYISQSSSFINILRLQGIPDWYNSPFVINENHPYALAYATKAIYVIASFALPILAFSALLLAKTPSRRRWIGLFALISLVSLIFVSGTHPPLGFIYAFFYEKVPGFTIFRTPFYKFGSAFFLSTIILICFTLSRLIELSARRVGNTIVKKILGSVLVTITITSWFIYHKPLLSPLVLNWQKDSTTRVAVPEYVQKFKDWSQNENTEGRILLLPPLDDGWKVDKYSWGYWSLSTLPSMLIGSNTITNDSSLRPEEKEWVWELYTRLEEGQEEDIVKLASRLGVRYFLIRKDVSAGTSLMELRDPLMFDRILSQFNFLEKSADFGQWILYKIKDFPEQKIHANSSLVKIPQQQLVLYRYFAQDQDVFLEKKKEPIIPDNLFLQEFHNYACESCLIESIETRSVLPVVRVLPNSPLYKLKKLNEQLVLTSASNEQEKMDTYLGLVFRRAGEVKKMLDFGVKEKYLVEDLKVMNDYLVTAYQILESSSDSRINFQQAKQILEVFDPVEINFRIEIEKAKTGTFGESVIQGMTDVLWQIYRFKNFYQDILQERGKWANEKLYTIDVLPSSFESLFVNAHTLPTGSDGKRVYPEEIILLQNNSETKLNYTLTANSNLLKIETPSGFSGKATLVLRFPNLPNKFILGSPSIEQTTNGAVSCVSGRINRFDSTRSYRLELTAARTNQALKLFIREEKVDTRKTTYFLRGDKEVAIYPLVSYEPFVYLYNPRSDLGYSTVYICSNNKEKPEIVQVVAKEIFAPSVILSQNGKKINDGVETPQVEYQKVNPTRYSVTVKNAQNPFALVFNERYDPLWALKQFNKDSEVVLKNHFVINGYANGWEVQEKGDLKFIIEYAPQKIFNWSILISVLYGVLCVGGVIYFIKRKGGL